MADVFKNEMNWSTYQDKQLSVLTSLERSFNNNLNMSKAVQDNLSSIQSSMSAMLSAAKALAEFANGLSYSQGRGGRSSSNARAARDAIASYSKRMNELHEIEMKNAEELYKKNMEYLDEQLKKSREDLENERKRKQDEKEAAEEQEAANKKFLSGMTDYANKLGKMADNYLTASNQFMKITGAGSAIIDMKDDIVEDIIDDLNKDTGNYFNYIESYQKLASIASAASIGSVEAMKELTRPILLADASLDANITDIAKLFNRFYTRYSFSSSEMEGIVDEIRGNTAGNAANAQATLENISKMENLIAIYTEGDKDKMKDMVDSISHYTSYLESMGVDTSTITDTMYDIMLGNKEALSPHILAALENAGSSFEEAQYLLRNDVNGMEKVVNMFATGTEELIGNLVDSSVAGMSMDAFGIPKEYLDLYAAFNTSGYQTFEEFLENQSDELTAAENVEDMYVSGVDKANRYLEQIANDTANIQYDLGLGLTDIVTAYGAIRGITDVFSAGKTVFSNLFGSTSASSSSGGPTLSFMSTGGNTSGSTSVGNTGGGSTSVGNSGSSPLSFMSSGGALSGAGAAVAGAAGGVVAGVTVVDTIGDLVKASETNDWREKKDKQTEAGIQAGAAALGAAIGSVIAPGVGTLIGAGIGGGASMIFGDDLAETITDASDGTTQLKQTMIDMMKAQDDLDKSMRASDSFEKLEKIYKRQLEEVKTLTPGTESYDRALSGLQQTINTFKEKYPGYIELEENELAIKEESLETVKQLTETEKKLADIRKKEVIAEGAKNADILEGNVANAEKSAEKNQKKQDAIDQLTNYYEGLQKYRDEFDNAYTLQADGERHFDVSKLSPEALAAYDALSNKEFKQLYKDAGLDTWNDGISWATLPMYYKEGGVERLLDGGWKGLERENAESGEVVAIVEAEKAAMSNAYLELVATLERALGQSFEDAATQYADMTATEQYKFRDTLADLRDINEAYDQIPNDLRISHEDLANLAGVTQYALGTNYITHDQLAYLHEGEAVTPKQYNPAANRNELEVLREQASAQQDQISRSNEESNELLSTLAESISEIKEFLSYWREDNIKRETINNAKEKHSTSTKFVSRYMV